MRKIIILSLGLLCIIISIAVFGVMKQNPESIGIVHFGVVNKDAINVSINDVLLKPKKYKGKLIRVIGYGNFHKEGSVIRTKDYFENRAKHAGAKPEAIPIEFNFSILNVGELDLYKYQDKQILVEGVYNTSKKGINSTHDGTIDNITRFDLWEKN